MRFSVLPRDLREGDQIDHLDPATTEIVQVPVTSVKKVRLYGRTVYQVRLQDQQKPWTLQPGNSISVTRETAPAAGYTGPPHPDYPNMAWSEPSVEGKVLAAIEKSSSPREAADSIMAVLDSVGYDSMDREMAFWIASQTKGWDYNDIYDAWLGV